MKIQKPSGLMCAVVAVLVTAAVAPVRAAEPTPSQMTKAELVTVVGQVLALDLATREVRLAGPLGGEIEAEVAPEVKNLDQVKVGDLVELAYYQSIAVSVHKKGEPNPLFEGGDASSAAPGERPAAQMSKQEKITVTVVSVDPETRMLVVQGSDGTLFPTEVKRPEFVAKMKQLKPGDQLDVVVTEAVAVSVTPATAGAAPSATYTAGTLIVDKGEVLRVMGTTLLVRNEQGRTVRVKVDPLFKFLIDGQETSVTDLKPGMRLARTAFRVTDVQYVEAP